jgi:hypothetical protein
LPLTVVWLLCFGELLDARNTSGQLLWAAALGTSATALFAVHGRMIVAVALTAVGLCLLAILRRVTLPPLLVGLCVIAGGLVAVRRLDDFLISRNYGGHAPDEVNQRLWTLRTVHGVGAFARNLLGQSWYVLVATLGVVALWVVIGGLRGLRRRDRMKWGTPEFVLALLATTGLGLLVVSALSFPEVERPDMMVYGRYIEVVVPPLLALGLVRLGGMRRLPSWRLVLAAIAVSTAVIAVLRLAVHPPGEPNRWNIASLPFLTLSLGPLEFLGAGAVAAGVVVGLAILVKRAPALLAPVVLLLFLPTTAVAVNNPVFAGDRSFYPSAWTSPGAAAPDARVVAFDTDHGGGVYVYQWFMPRARFILFSSTAGNPPARYVISSRAWGRLHSRLGARPIWTDPGRDHTLFRLVQLGRGRSASSASPARSGPAAGSSTLVAR